MAKLIVLSGIQPTGALHVGNYLGAISNWLELQEKADCTFLIVDWHSMTVDYDPKAKHHQILETAVDLLASGLDPTRCTIAVQSQFPEHLELAWYLSTVAPVARLELMTQYKDKTAAGQKANAGLFTYPVLQAADILMYKATLVPVGEDQIQHIEFTRDLARAFNRKFGETFPEPEPYVMKIPRLMSLVDPTKKMSKSLGPKHYIALSDTPETIRSKVKVAVTDTKAKGKEMAPGVKTLFVFLDAFGDKKIYLRFKREYDAGTIRYSDLKPAVAEAIIDFFSAFRKTRSALLAHPEKIEQVLEEGARRARRVVEQTMREVRNKVGIIGII